MNEMLPANIIKKQKLSKYKKTAPHFLYVSKSVCPVFIFMLQFCFG